MLQLLMMAMQNPEDETKFAQIYNKYCNYVFYISKSFFENEMDREDAVYTAFLKIALNISKIKDVETKETKGYITTITTNTCITMINKKNKIKEINIEDIGEAQAGQYSEKGFKEAEKGDFLSSYENCVKQLTKNQYELLYLRYVNDMSMKEIASVLDIKESTVKQRIYYAKQKLAELLKEELVNE